MSRQILCATCERRPGQWERYGRFVLAVADDPTSERLPLCKTCRNDSELPDKLIRDCHAQRLPKGTEPMNSTTAKGPRVHALHVIREGVLCHATRREREAAGERATLTAEHVTCPTCLAALANESAVLTL